MLLNFIKSARSLDFTSVDNQLHSRLKIKIKEIMGNHERGKVRTHTKKSRHKVVV